MNATDDRPSGAVAWMTGAASGIGRATARRWADAPGPVVILDLPDADTSWTEGDERFTVVPGDVRDEAANEECVRRAELLGGLGAVFLNAGVPVSGTIESVDLERFDLAMDVNVRAVVIGLRAAAPVLRRRGSGSIVVTASVSGLGGEYQRWPYNTAKGAVINLVKAVAQDLGPDGVRVNAVCPGPVLTGMTESLADADPDRFQALQDTIPLGRWGAADEVAAVVEFLLDDASSFVSGAIVPVDGGSSAAVNQDLRAWRRERGR
ncbi:MAG: SDR family oxidoreductase [Ilumatobacteraceae bacterium]